MSGSQPRQPNQSLPSHRSHTEGEHIATSRTVRQESHLARPPNRDRPSTPTSRRHLHGPDRTRPQQQARLEPNRRLNHRRPHPPKPNKVLRPVPAHRAARPRLPSPASRTFPAHRAPRALPVFRHSPCQPPPRCRHPRSASRPHRRCPRHQRCPGPDSDRTGVSGALAGNPITRNRTELDAIEFLGPTGSKIGARFASGLTTGPPRQTVDFRSNRATGTRGSRREGVRARLGACSRA